MVDFHCWIGVAFCAFWGLVTLLVLDFQVVVDFCLDIFCGFDLAGFAVSCGLV